MDRARAGSVFSFFSLSLASYLHARRVAHPAASRRRHVAAAHLARRRPARAHAGERRAAARAGAGAGDVVVVGKVRLVARGRLQDGERVALEADFFPVFEDLGG